MSTFRSFSAQTNATLALANLQFPDAGNYSAVVFNSASSTQSAAAFLQVRIGPAVSVQPTNVAVRIKPDISAAPSTNVTFTHGSLFVQSARPLPMAGHVSGASAADYDSQYWTHDIYLGSSKENSEAQRYFERALKGLNSGQTSWNGYQHNALFVDLATNDYVNVAFLMDVAHEADCRAVVSADLNEDGKPDLLVTAARFFGSPNHMRHELYVYLNQIENSNHWIGVQLVGKSLSPIGTRIRLTRR